MALLKGHRFPVEFGEAFPRGLVLVGEIEPDLEYQSQEDKARGRDQRQRVDDITKLRQWKATVTDPDEPKSKRASFDVIFTAEVQPAPLPDEVLPGMRPVELRADGLAEGDGSGRVQVPGLRVPRHRRQGSRFLGRSATGVSHGRQVARRGQASG